jgi:C4-dicarboxylate-specific signal transduction histidine kinase
MGAKEPGGRPLSSEGEWADLKGKVILVVDDEPLNLKMMQALLSREGCQVLSARSGREALTLAEQRPDLILLDIMMPELNGLDTCRLLKEKEDLRDIPIVFLSALHDTETKTEGLRLGGVDFIAKPFQREELLARVRNHLTLKEQKERLKAYTQKLEHMVEQRTRQLVHADRLSTLGTLVAVVAHEINNPLQAVMSHTDLLFLDLESVKEKAERIADGTLKKDLSEFCQSIEGALQEIQKGCRRLQKNIRQLKQFGKRGDEKPVVMSIKQPIEDALAIMQARLKSGVTLDLNLPDRLQVMGNPLQLSQVFINLIQNALDAMDGRQGRLDISAAAEGGLIRVDFKDSGPGIPPDLWGKVFHPFFTTKGEKEGTGLGLFISRLIVENHRGSLELIPHAEAGAWFRITLPQVSAETALTGPLRS